MNREAPRIECEVVHATRPALVVHGGAWDIPDDELEAHRAGVLAAIRLGFGLLGGGASALDTVESAVALLEDDRALNAGAGAVLNRFGEAVLDGSIMDGEDLRVGAVAAVSTIRNPVRVARRVLEATRQVLLVGRGAEEFAEEQGFPPIRPEDLIEPARGGAAAATSRDPPPAATRSGGHRRRGGH